MENRSKALARSAPTVDSGDRVSQLRENWRLARTAHKELLVTGMPRVNVLLVGVDGITHNLLDMLLPDLANPIATVCPRESFALPQIAMARTMILHEVGELTLEQQLQLLDWLERAVGRTQVVSTTSEPLIARVRNGEFIEALYYRLNTVCVDLST